MCSIEGACEAPIPPTTLAIATLLHLPADLGQRRVRHARQLDHHVDGHPGAPEPDPVAPPDQLALLVREPELLHPPLLVGVEELALRLVLERVRGLVEADAARRGVLVEEVELGREILRLNRIEP